MKSIVIRQLTLLNFKGIRNLTVDFDLSETNIFGYNGTGKTTIFDAFTWLLFGKDSKDRKDFNIKTLDANNQPIERIPHEVTACIEVNGEEINLKKCYNEVWTKKRGSAVETFNGHSVECFYNDVPCSVTEYAKKIAELCDEQVFKLITNPLYFTAQKKDYQRTMLFRLAGDVTNDDVLARYPEFTDLVIMLSGKTLEELKREVQSKKRKIKDGIDNIPARIDERKRDMPETQDWGKLEAEITELERQLADIDGQIADRSKSYNELTKQKQEIARQLSKVKSDITAREYDLKDKLLAEYNQGKRENENAVQRVATLNNERRYKTISLQRAEKELADYQAERAVLLEEWHNIKSETQVIDDDIFYCPVCKRPLDESDIEAKKEQMRTEFNATISRKLERNKSKGMEIKAAIEAKEAEITTINNDIFNIDNEIAQITASKTYNTVPAMPDIAPAINADRTIIELRNKAADLQNQLDQEITLPATNDLTERKHIIEDNIRANKVWLADRDRIVANNKRIAELEKEYTESQSQLAELEGVEYNIQQFSKARIEQVESRINGMFNLVKFKMFEQQINGGEIETCEATVNGVPFSDLNDAMKINAGLDIINAISRANGIVAPIFIDNRESVCEIVSGLAQIVNLIVDANCKTLKIE
ncbi:MAG: hypothetical protein IKV46_08370 [Bacteroidales bacterium]|nr:hypothetical protein [Bacteroidales bacterium]